MSRFTCWKEYSCGCESCGDAEDTKVLEGRCLPDDEAIDPIQNFPHEAMHIDIPLQQVVQTLAITPCVDRLNGHWCDLSDAEICTIHAGVVRWEEKYAKCSASVSFSVEGRVILEIEGNNHHGILEESDTLRWDDGDLWLRRRCILDKN